MSSDSPLSLLVTPFDLSWGDSPVLDISPKRDHASGVLGLASFTQHSFLGSLPEHVSILLFTTHSILLLMYIP